MTQETREERVNWISAQIESILEENPAPEEEMPKSRRRELLWALLNVWGESPQRDRVAARRTFFLVGQGVFEIDKKKGRN